MPRLKKETRFALPEGKNRLGFCFIFRPLTYGRATKPRNYREARGKRLQARRLLDVREDAVELVEAVVVDDEAALA